MSLKALTLNLEVGQTILVGQNHKPATITKIEFHEQSGEVSLNTTLGPRKALTFKLCEDTQPVVDNPADKYR
jgi:hypothetical protein|tara:strand:+ start:916 stop:1131 length:216 start_codon:yes stop_codon:yes gene_type:complete